MFDLVPKLPGTAATAVRDRWTVQTGPQTRHNDATDAMRIPVARWESPLTFVPCGVIFRASGIPKDQKTPR